MWPRALASTTAFPLCTPLQYWRSKEPRLTRRGMTRASDFEISLATWWWRGSACKKHFRRLSAVLQECHADLWDVASGAGTSRLSVESLEALLLAGAQAGVTAASDAMKCACKS